MPTQTAAPLSFVTAASEVCDGHHSGRCDMFITRSLQDDTKSLYCSLYSTCEISEPI